MGKQPETLRKDTKLRLVSSPGDSAPAVPQQPAFEFSEKIPQGVSLSQIEEHIRDVVEQSRLEEEIRAEVLERRRRHLKEAKPALQS